MDDMSLNYLTVVSKLDDKKKLTPGSGDYPSPAFFISFRGSHQPVRKYSRIHDRILGVMLSVLDLLYDIAPLIHEHPDASS